MRVLYVYGLEHSGSTAFAMKLAQDEKGLAVGEVYDLFQGKKSGEADEGKCSCFRSLESCPFWKGFFKEELSSLQAKYEWLLKRAEKERVDTIVDSSKTPEGLEAWLALAREKDISIEVFFTVRNPFKYAVSMRKTRERRGLPSKSIVWYVLLWLRKQWRRERRLKKLVKKYEVVDGERIDVGTKEPLHHVVNSNRNKFMFAEKGAKE